MIKQRKKGRLFVFFEKGFVMEKIIFSYIPIIRAKVPAEIPGTRLAIPRTKPFKVHITV